ncbi:MAG: hypothetical protein RL308_1058 [Bacteroidota bacterium]|jgi:hypothetical protein
MYYITLDTNTWIYLANGTEPVRLLNYISEEVDNGNITILVPQTVAEEWEIHKDKTVRQGTIKHFKDITNAMEVISKLLGDRAEKNVFNFLLDAKEDKAYFQDFINNFKKKEQEIAEAISENIKLIDSLFKKKSTVINIKDEIYVKSGKFALEKKAPFGQKNSFADALILFSFLDYVKVNAINNSMFISYNTKDFCEKNEHNKPFLHKDLENEFKQVNSQYYKTISEAINTIKEGIVSPDELELIEELQSDDEWNDDIEFCRICQEYNGHSNLVNFGRDYELHDERIRYIYITNQTEFEFSSKLPRSKSNLKIPVGHCDWCNSEHFECVECSTINAILDDEYNEVKQCLGCGLKYYVEYNLKTQNSNYKILKNTITCQKCGNEFDEENIIENICIGCEKIYSSGDFEI